MRRFACWVCRYWWGLSPGWGQLCFIALPDIWSITPWAWPDTSPSPAQPVRLQFAWCRSISLFGRGFCLLSRHWAGWPAGLLVYSLAPEAEGHGTDAVIAAYHSPQGQIRPRVPLIKIVASALTIGTGGSGGREGPIAQIGAGFGSVLANLLHCARQTGGF